MTRLHRSANLTSLTIALVLGLGIPLSAETTKSEAPGAATPAYQAAMNTMMTSMMIPYSGNADVDFVRGMIPHHQGAVDNARIVLEFGTDPEVRKFAEGVIAAQEAEIKWLQEWLAKNGG
jgi:uncharacterized protein (DUF305 family)